MRFLKIILLYLLCYNILSANNSIKIIPPQSEYDSSHDYFKGLLELILDETKDKYGKTDIQFSSKMEQGRAFLSLKNREILDIHWAGTSLQRESDFTVIKIPLVKGLLGYRLFIINKKNKKLFDEIKTFDDLKKFKACQGTHWPDTKILENSGLKVVKNTQYELMFSQISVNRCDYFPRGVHEIVSEIKARENKYENLMMYENLIIYYPFPMYFFVAKENIILSKRVEEGLLRIIDSGVFDSYIKSHSVTKHLFPIENWMDAKVFKLENPFMNIDKRYFNKKYWILLEEIK